MLCISLIESSCAHLERELCNGGKDQSEIFIFHFTALNFTRQSCARVVLQESGLIFCVAVRDRKLFNNKVRSVAKHFASTKYSLIGLIFFVLSCAELC